MLINKNYSKEFIKTSGLLLLFSSLVLVEGVTRTVASIDRDFTREEWKGSATAFPPVILLAAGLWEVLFGITGFLVGLYMFLFEKGNSSVTAITLFAQLCGIFTFVVFVIALPIYTVVNDDPPTGFSTGEANFSTSMGILGSIALCASLQGGQFFFAFRLFNLQRQLHDSTRNRMNWYTTRSWRIRLFLFSALNFIFAFAQIAYGSFLRNDFGGGPYDEPIVAVPFFVSYPQIGITCGVVVFVAACFGMYIAVSLQSPVSQQYFNAFLILFLMSWLAQILLMNLISVGYAPSPFVPAAPQLVSLSIAMTLLPVFMMFKLAESIDEDKEIQEPNRAQRQSQRQSELSHFEPEA